MAGRLVLSAIRKSSGKTTVTMGLARMLANAGHAVQPFKKGPDYIDPLWLGAAARRDCLNLDFHTQQPGAIRDMVAGHAEGDSLALVEGNKGLFDGVDPEGRTSTAALARLLEAPVVLVIDSEGMTRGIAPLLLGYQAFDPELELAGVILNKVGGERHEGKLRRAVADHTDLPVLGALQRDREMTVDERHLGLIPAGECPDAEARIESTAARIAEGIDREALVEAAARAPALPAATGGSDRTRPPQAPVRIGIARDSAFAFYYPDDLAALEAAGATLIPVDTLHDSSLPPIDGLFLGGGFPETHMAALEANSALRGALRQAIEAGLPTYAECGGLVYLCRELRHGAEERAMVGAIPARAVMHERPRGRGYMMLRATGAHPWEGVGGERIPAHEFHYTAIEGLPPDQVFAYEVERGTGIDGTHDGLVRHNLLAVYGHQRTTRTNPWARRFVDFVRRRGKLPHPAKTA